MTTSILNDSDVCANCDTPTSGNYCNHCGQETHLHPASAREFLHEFVGHYVAAENKLWGTLVRLLFRPGALTNEYIRGRRVRFVQPLRLYLTLSVLFFALLKLTSSGFDVVKLDPGDEKVFSQQVRKEAKKEALSDTEDNLNINMANVLSPALNKSWEHFEHLPNAQKMEVFTQGFYHYAPSAMFCMLPLFALYLKVLYLGTGKRYGEHLLFSLHTNAFAFALFSVMLLVPEGFLRFVLWMWVIGYLPWAMRRVYHKSRFGTFWRWTLLMSVYTLTMGAGFLGAMAAGILTAGH